MNHFHLLKTDLHKPERFTYPFSYEPHPLCLLAVEEVKKEIAKIDPREGKMFGVLVAEKDGELGFLAAYSGLLEGRNDWDYFVPPVFDAQQPEGYFKQTEKAISALNHESPTIELSIRRKKMSEDLQVWLFHQYKLLNARGEQKDLVEIWQDYHSRKRIRERYPLPPGGTGDCCAPKLLQYAYSNGMRPVCMAEFWWGASSGLIRHHGHFYPACRGKCKPVLTWMLQGLHVDPDPEETSFSHDQPVIVYEDEALVALNKPSGMLSIPGKTEEYSIATWAKAHWPEALPAHRLDMWTSGIILVAKNLEAYHNLQEQFASRTVKKRYLAIIEGEPEKEHGIIDLPLRYDPIDRPRQVVDHEKGKRAITEYRVLKIVNGRTLLALYPHTGRTHQLRMHCAHPEGLNCPIVGDTLYGSKADRLYLQAQAVKFLHPVTGRHLHIELPYPFGNLIPYNNK